MDRSALYVAGFVTLSGLATAIYAYVERTSGSFNAATTGLACIIALLIGATYGVLGVARENAFPPAMGAIALAVVGAGGITTLVGIIMILLAAMLALVARRLVRPAPEWYGQSRLVTATAIPTILVIGFALAAYYRAEGILIVLAMLALAIIGAWSLRKVMPDTVRNFDDLEHAEPA